MLIVLGKGKNNNGTVKMNLTGVAAPHITGNTIIDDTTVHTKDTIWIDHTIDTPNTRTRLNTMVVHADTNRLG